MRYDEVPGVGHYATDVVHGRWQAIFEWFRDHPSNLGNPTLTVTVSPPGTGSVIRNASTPYSYGQHVQLTAVPANGWSFSAWTGDLIGNANPVTVTLDADMTVTATFTQNVDHFVIASISSPKTAGVAFSITIAAVDASNNTVASYHYRNTLTDLTGTISPTSTGNFTAGVWTGSVTIATARTGDTISTTGSSKSGVSNAFNVVASFQLSVSVNPAGSGTITLSPPGGVYVPVQWSKRVRMIQAATISLVGR